VTQEQENIAARFAAAITEILDPEHPSMKAMARDPRPAMIAALLTAHFAVPLALWAAAKER